MNYKHLTAPNLEILNLALLRDFALPYPRRSRTDERRRQRSDELVHRWGLVSQRGAKYLGIEHEVEVVKTWDSRDVMSRKART